MAYDDNIYYHPEKFDLEVVAEIDYSDGNYNFDTRVVWRHVPSDVFYMARDSGCSCPSPFEDYTSLADLDRLDLDTLEAEVRADGGYTNITPGEGMDFLEKVHKAIV